MTNYNVKTVDDFITAAAPKARKHLREVRSTIKIAMPDAQEGISYGKPYYKYHGYLAGFDAYTNHLGFELWGNRLRAEDREALEKKGYKTGNKSFQIPYDQKVPTEIMKQIIKAQAKINQESSKKA